MRTLARALVALLLLAAPARGALLQKDESFNGANNVTSHSVAMASVTAGSAIVVGIIAYANASPPTITISGGGKPTDTRGNTYTELSYTGGTPPSSTTHFRMRTFYCLNSTAGANTVSVSLSSSVFGLGIWYAEVPAAASTYFLGSVTAGGVSQNPSIGTVTGNSASGLMMAYIGAWGQTYTGGGAGWTFSTTANGNAFLERSSSGSFAASYTSSASDDWIGSALSFSPTAASTFPAAILLRNHPVM